MNMAIDNHVENIKKWYKVEDIFEDIEGDPDNVLMNIPPEINEHLGLKEGDTLDVTTEGSSIILSKKYDKKMRKLKIEIDDDTADNVVRASMLDLYESLKDDRHNLNQRIKELKDFEKEDLEYNKTLLAAAITIIKYITAHNNLPKELK